MLTFGGCFGLVWIYVAAMPMGFMDYDYPYFLAKRTMLAECRPDDVAVFGDSRARASIIPAMIGVPVTNFAMGGLSPVETYFDVRRALNCPTPPRLIIIAHSQVAYSDHSRYWNYARMGFLNYPDLRAVETDAAHLGDDLTKELPPGARLPEMLLDRLYQLRFPSFYFSSLLSGFGVGRLFVNQAAVHQALLARGHALYGTAPGSAALAGEAHMGRFSASPLIDLYFSRILELAAERHVPVYVISLPINDATCAQMPAAQQDQYQAYLASKAAAFPSLHVIGPMVPCWPNRLFGDEMHLNEDGAIAYSRPLSDWLKGAYGGTPSPDMTLTPPE